MRRGVLLLAGLAIAGVVVAAPAYQRDDWLPRWPDQDGDCQTTRVEVLLRDALEAQLDAARCRVLRGRWVDPYAADGRVLTDPQEVDVDHTVPLEWAARHGARAWPPELKRRFAVDPLNLRAVSARHNRAKGNRGPSEWVPPNVAKWCQYGLDWVVVLFTYRLEPGPADREALLKLIALCPRPFR